MRNEAIEPSGELLVTAKVRGFAEAVQGTAIAVFKSVLEPRMRPKKVIRQPGQYLGGGRLKYFFFFLRTRKRSTSAKWLDQKVQEVIVGSCNGCSVEIIQEKQAREEERRLIWGNWL